MGAGMERIEAIRRHELFCAEYQALWAAEQTRRFCRHDLEHLLSVARLMYLYTLEEGTGLPKELIYATALLHDIGRHAQLSRGIPHEVAGRELAGRILQDAGFPDAEICRVQQAISAHRQGGDADLLAAYLYRADKQSRACYACAARADCNWPPGKQNSQILY